MARNRKRANQTRRTQPVAARRGAGADARGDRAREAGVPSNGAPDPLGHATPDAELVEAQLAAGREDPIEDLSSPEEERELEELATGANGGGGGAGRGPRATGPGPGGSGGAAPGGSGGAEVAVPAGKAAARRPSPASRLVTFAKGSWAELQRVQWPDRRQVMQATGVVIGFVIVAGIFLGAADWAAGKIMDFVLK